MQGGKGKLTLHLYKPELSWLNLYLKLMYIFYFKSIYVDHYFGNQCLTKLGKSWGKPISHGIFFSWHPWGESTLECHIYTA